MKSPSSQVQPWLFGPFADLGFIIAPAFVSVAVVLLMSGSLSAETSPVAWLILVAGIDVSHVYSTLWRTYFDPEERAKYRLHLVLIPLLCYVAGVALHLIGGLLFWRVMAYVAVFHFIRQQYGFMALYGRNDGRAGWERQLDKVVIYAATLYPIIHWHTHMPRPFNWFVQGDFWAIDLPWLSVVAGAVFAGLLVFYLGKEIFFAFQGRTVNLPKNLIILGTTLSWYVGIVYLQGDLAFTLTNVVSHGIPYMALVWIYGNKKAAKSEAKTGIGKYFQVKYLAVFVGVLLLFAYLEEGLWDALVWRDHVGLFPWASELLPNLQDSVLIAFVVPLLAVPQVTHYVLDGFIWKMRRSDGDLRKI